MNIFEDHIKSGKITTKEELKKCFWILAKNIHPDIVNSEYSDERFIKLKENFDEAFLLFPLTHKSNIPRYSYANLRDVFQDIVARGFPIAPELRTSVKAYYKGIREYERIVNSIDKDKGFKFSEAERELYEIRGDSIIQNPLFITIKMIIYNVVTYSYQPTNFSKNVINKLYNEIKDELIKKKLLSVCLYIEWLIKNIDNI